MQYSTSWQADFLDIAVIPSFYTASAKTGHSVVVVSKQLGGTLVHETRKQTPPKRGL
jgi:hypothetical protein